MANTKNRTKKLNLFLSLLLILVLGIRFYKLGQVPTGLYWDEQAMLLDAKSIAQTGKDIHQRSWLQAMLVSYGDYKLPVYTWLAAITVKIFGVNAFALRLPSALAGLSIIVIAYLIAKEIFSIKKKDKLLAIITLFVLGLSPWSIQFSRTGFEAHLGQLFLATSIFLVLKLKNKIWSFFIPSFLGAVATYCYYSVRFVWPVVFIAAVLWIILQDKLNFRQIVKGLIYIALSLASYYLLLQPIYRSPYYAASQQFRFSTKSVLNMEDWALQSMEIRAQVGNNLLTRIFYHRHLLLAQELIKNYADHLSLDFLFLHGDANLRHGTSEHGLFLLSLLPIFLAGLYYLAKDKTKSLILLLVWWMIALLPASVPEGTPHALRSLNALMPLALILIYGAFRLIKSIKLRKNKYKLFYLTYFLIIIFNFCAYINHYFVHYPQESAVNWQEGFDILAKKIVLYKDQYQNIIVENFDDRFYLWVLTEINDADFANLPLGNYSLNKIDNIQFINFDANKWKNEFIKKENLLILTTKNYYQFNSIIDQKLQEEIIYNKNNQPQFVLLTKK